MPFTQRQSGVTTLGFVGLVLVGASILFTAFKVVPVYVENRYITSALKSLVEGGEDLSEMTASEIRSQLKKFYTVNNVRVEGRDNIDIDKRSSGVLVTIAYEERIDFLYNIDLVFTFDNQLDSAQPERCCQPLDENSEP